MEPLALLDQINQIKSLHAGTQPLFKEFIKNKKYLLKERWEIFCEHGEFMLEIDLYRVSLQEMELADVKYSDMLEWRYSTAFFKDLIEMIHDTYGLTYCDENLNIDRLKEEILETGLSGFTNDW